MIYKIDMGQLALLCCTYKLTFSLQDSHSAIVSMGRYYPQHTAVIGVAWGYESVLVVVYAK